MKEVATKIETPTGREMKPIPTKNAVWTHIGNDTCHMLVRLPEWIRSRRICTTIRRSGA